MSADTNLMPDAPTSVMVAMSGGVDSSTAALLLTRAGHQVSGVTVRMWRQDGPDTEAARASEASARQVCALLGIPFHVIDLRDAFYERVVAQFAAGYADGQTPNPCVLCNRHIKFGALLDWARDQGAAYLATGHYARRRHVDGRYQLLRGLDRGKDQAYFLYVLDQRALSHVLFPLGALAKREVRQIARQAGLGAAERPESQDICFVPDGDYRGFLTRYGAGTIQPGPIYDTTGKERGTHQGLPFYTVGQRKGLGIAAPEPLYVLQIDTMANSLIVGTAAELGHSRLIAQEPSFVSGQFPQEPLQVTARIRSRARQVPATVSPRDATSLWVDFDQPLRDITPGQAVVFYRDQVVLGGGTISDIGG